MHDVLDLAEILTDEVTQRRESGYDVSGAEDVVQEALRTAAPDAVDRAFDALASTEIHADWPYVEPTALADIEATLVPLPEIPRLAHDDDVLRDRLLAAWLGRCAGCNLGKPVEGWHRDRIRRYLELADAYPIDDYLPVVDSPPDDLRLNWCWPETTRGNVAFMARDDDLDYTILGLHVLETHGPGFGPMDIAEEWMDHLPFTQVYTAERAAYRNLVSGRVAPETATHRNPYREWIGAQIRADMWGYVSPGDPQRAIGMAYQDASLSHTQNGIYGEMWAAALIAVSFVIDDPRRALEASLAFVPPRSRLTEAIHDVIQLHERGLEWEKARDEIEDRYYAKYSFVHTVNNAALVSAALLWGEGDFTKTIGLAVQGGWDTDCTGATTGSVFGAMYGTEALQGHWVEPLNDLIRSAIIGFDHSKVSDLTDRTLRLARGEAPASAG